MTLNVGSTDRIVRFILAAIFVGLAIAVSGVWQWIFAVLAVIMFVTGTIKFCPIWAVLRMNTLGKNQSR